MKEREKVERLLNSKNVAGPSCKHTFYQVERYKYFIKSLKMGEIKKISLKSYKIVKMKRFELLCFKQTFQFLTKKSLIFNVSYTGEIRTFNIFIPLSSSSSLLLSSSLSLCNVPMYNPRVCKMKIPPPTLEVMMHQSLS